MNVSKVFQFILGVFLGFFILGLSGAAAGYYFFTRMAVNPARPVFAEERTDSESKTIQEEVKPESAAEDKKKDAENAQPQEEQAEEPKEELEPGAYRATVSWPDGLSLRENPDLEGELVGGLAYEQEIVILKTSDDGRWERVRVPDTGEEGWVKAGNTEKVE